MRILIRSLDTFPYKYKATGEKSFRPLNFASLAINLFLRRAGGADGMKVPRLKKKIDNLCHRRVMALRGVATAQLINIIIRQHRACPRKKKKLIFTPPTDINHFFF